MNIIAIDPGERYNGLALYSSERVAYTAMEIGEHDYQSVWKLVMHGQWEYVVCEDFTAKHISHYGITTVRVVGGVEAICMLRGIQLHRPRAQDRIPFKDAADKMLVKIYGKLPPRDHIQSAMAHLLRFQSVMLGMKVR